MHTEGETEEPGRVILAVISIIIIQRVSKIETRPCNKVLPFPTKYLYLDS